MMRFSASLSTLWLQSVFHDLVISVDRPSGRVFPILLLSHPEDSLHCMENLSSPHLPVNGGFSLQSGAFCDFTPVCCLICLSERDFLASCCVKVIGFLCVEGFPCFCISSLLQQTLSLGLGFCPSSVINLYSWVVCGSNRLSLFLGHLWQEQVVPPFSFGVSVISFPS